MGWEEQEASRIRQRRQGEHVTKQRAAEDAKIRNERIAQLWPALCDAIKRIHRVLSRSAAIVATNSRQRAGFAMLWLILS